MINDLYNSPLPLLKVHSNLDYSIKKKLFDDGMPSTLLFIAQILPDKTYIKKLYLDRLESCMYDDTP